VGGNRIPCLSSRVADRWRFVSFRGANQSEWRGVVDLVAIRKNSRKPSNAMLKRGDLFDIVLIQGWLCERTHARRLPQTPRSEAVIPRPESGAASVEKKGVVKVPCPGAEPQLATVVERGAVSIGHHCGFIQTNLPSAAAANTSGTISVPIPSATTDSSSLDLERSTVL
jgi:hypothetical protein